MGEEILYYEVTNSYGGITKGLRFQVVHKSSRHIDTSLKEGLEKATGIPASKINIGMLKCKKV